MKQATTNLKHDVPSLKYEEDKLRQEGISMKQERTFSTEKVIASSLTDSHKENGIPRHSFDALKAFCEDRLRKVMEKEGNELTPERRQRFSEQAEKTATYLLHSHVLKGRMPTEQEISAASLRAKYELKRIPEIREEIIKGWHLNDNFKESERILAHSIAERRASIEGRLFLQAKQQVLRTPSNIEALAQQELKEHRTQTDSLAYKLAYTHSSAENILSSEAAQHCTKNIFRYMETHGEKPSETQIATMMQIAQTLEHRDYTQLYHSTNAHEIDFFRRHEADNLLKQMSDPGNTHELSTYPGSIHEFRDKVSQYLNHIDKVALPHDLYDGHDLPCPALPRPLRPLSLLFLTRSSMIMTRGFLCKEIFLSCFLPGKD